MIVIGKAVILFSILILSWGSTTASNKPESETFQEKGVPQVIEETVDLVVLGSYHVFSSVWDGCSIIFSYIWDTLDPIVSYIWDTLDIILNPKGLTFKDHIDIVFGCYSYDVDSKNTSGKESDWAFSCLEPYFQPGYNLYDQTVLWIREQLRFFGILWVFYFVASLIFKE